MGLPEFETERLILRPYCMADVDAAYAVNLDPEVSQYTGDGGPKTRDEMTAILREHVIADYAKYGYGRYAVILKESAEYIGFSGLKYLADIDSVDIGYRFAKKMWGQGIATESCWPFLDYGFKTLGLKKIIGMVEEANMRSIRVLEKLGFSLERRFVEDGVGVMQHQRRYDTR